VFAAFFPCIFPPVGLFDQYIARQSRHCEQRLPERERG
jgi:hypothetical protein